MAAKKVLIIGGGIGGLATAALLAKAGYKVALYEKNDYLGGKAGLLEVDGFRFDTGPSWLLMSDVFAHFFELFGQELRSVLDLQKLDPAYKVFFESADPITIFGDQTKDAATFEAIEPGAGDALERYVTKAERTYGLAKDHFLYSNFSSYRRMATKPVIAKAHELAGLSLRSINSYIGSYVKDQRLRQILGYPMVFLGTTPYDAPALYHLMSYLDFKQGVFYPRGGMYELIKAIMTLARLHGAKLHTNRETKRILVENGKATGVEFMDGHIEQADIVISNADLHYTETALLPTNSQTYPARYWHSKTAGPGALLYYLGVKGPLPQLAHHNLFFTADWKQNFNAIFKHHEWPQPASMYVCKPSATDPTVAPKGHENVFILVPVPADPTADAAAVATHAEAYLDQFIAMSGIKDLKKRIVYKKVAGPADFESSLYAWHGSALGLAHTLRQSAMWRPRNRSKKVKDLFYVGGNTIPGIGLPMCLIGAELIYKHLSGDNSSQPVAEIKPIGRA